MVRAPELKRGRAGLVVVMLLLTGILFSASTAGAQSAADQYIPKLDKAGASDPAGGTASSPVPPSGGESTAPAPAPQDVLAASETRDPGDSGGGSLPGGGGFPLTSFATILGAAVLLGLLARLLAPAFGRGFDSIRAL